MTKGIIILCIGAVVSVTGLSAPASLSANTDVPFCAGQLTMGLENWPPFLYLNTDDTVAGLDFELVSAVLTRCGCSIAPFKTPIPWKRQLRWVESGALDLVTGASKTPDREKYAIFSAPYRNESVTLFVRKGDSMKYRITTFQDIIPLKFILGTYTGSYYGEEFVHLMKQPDFSSHVESVSDDTQNIKKLINFRVDGILLDSVAGVTLLKNEGLLGTRVEQHPMRPVVTGNIHVMFSKKTIPPKLVEEFNRHLSEIKTDGTYSSIMKTYLK